MTRRATDPLRIPAEFWDRADVTQALRQRDIRQLLILVRRHTGAGQTTIGAAIGLSQGTISDIMRGKRQVTANHVLLRIASGLDMPNHSRTLLLELVIADPMYVDAQRAIMTANTEEDVYRRNALRLTGAVLPTLLSARVTDIARALTPYDLATPASQNRPPTIAQLTNATAAAKRSYQSCRYASALDQIPSLLASVQAARSAASGDELLAVEAIAAGAYQVAGSVLLKLGDNGLATLAADRSMNAALRSQHPLAIAASARIVTHALMSAGHTRRAKEIASTAAQRLDSGLRTSSPEAISVYGALVLRAAIAAARAEDRAGARELLDEADHAAHRLGRDDNAQWTAFGPTNVQLHRVHVAVLLGDAGTAIDLAEQVDLRRVALAERRASVLIDVAHAYTQWGKLEHAYRALASAEQVAPEEVQTRTTVHRLVMDLAQRGPRSVRSNALALAERIGIHP